MGSLRMMQRNTDFKEVSTCSNLWWAQRLYLPWEYLTYSKAYTRMKILNRVTDKACDVGKVFWCFAKIVKNKFARILKLKDFSKEFEITELMSAKDGISYGFKDTKWILRMSVIVRSGLNLKHIPQCGHCVHLCFDKELLFFSLDANIVAHIQKFYYF